MKILLIEDKAQHINTAKLFAAESEHEIIIVTSYDEAEKALCGKDQYGEKNRFGRYPYEQKFDIVLTDLLLPASQSGQNNSNYEGEMPYGVIFVLLAIKTGVKKIGLLTDGSHHSHPLIWALDPLGGCDGKPFMIGDIKLLFASHSFIYTKSTMVSNETTLSPGDPRIDGKAWSVLLAKLLAD